MRALATGLRRRGCCSSCRWPGCSRPRCASRPCRRRARSNGCPTRSPGRTTPASSSWCRSATFIGNSLLVVALAVPLTLLTASWAGLAMAQLHEPAAAPAGRAGDPAADGAGHGALADPLRDLQLPGPDRHRVGAGGAGGHGLEPAVRAALLLDLPAYAQPSCSRRRGSTAPASC